MARRSRAGAGSDDDFLDSPIAEDFLTRFTCISVTAPSSLRVHQIRAIFQMACDLAGACLDSRSSGD